jgi:hypothetical protein
MECSGIRSASLFLCFLAAVSPLARAQTAQDSSLPKTKVVPAGELPPPIPFSIPNATSPPAPSIEFRSSGQMAQEDRVLEAGAEPAIRRSAEALGIEFSHGKWTYRQLLCTALPNHLLLKFTRENGTGDLSVFTASISRSGRGRVRIVPVERRGYSLFSPAPVNAVTIAVFNRIRAEEPPSGAPDWLTTGLCYAALAGAPPQSARQLEAPGGNEFSTGAGAVLEVRPHGGAVIRIMELAETPRPMHWDLTFDGQGKLLKAEHAPSVVRTAKAVAPGVPIGQGSPIVENNAGLKGTLVPVAHSTFRVQPVPPGNTDLKGKPVPAAELVSRPVPNN